MRETFKVAVIGGGASGLLCAIELLSGKNALNADGVILLEKNDRVGKKLIATGNGQCNLFNTDMTENHFYGDGEFLTQFIDNCHKIDISAYFYKMGIPFCFDDEGRGYPISKQASSVLDIIRARLSEKGLNVQTNACVVNIIKKSTVFEIFTESGRYYAENVVLAVGGKTAKQFGTDGSAYGLAQNFGHKVTALYPSLVQLKTNLDSIRALKGLKERAKVSVYDGDAYLGRSVGDLLFTDYGVSGNAVFKVSPFAVSAKEPNLKIEFLPDISIKELENILIDRSGIDFFKNENMLCGLVNKRIGQAIIKTAKDKSERGVAYAVKNFNLKVTGNTGFNYAQVTKGGIKTNDVDKRSYESKICDNLYLVGEYLDVDGDCGGYNLTFAFTSGITSAKYIKKEWENK